MKNITVSVDDDLYHQARVVAAQKKTSVSALVKRFLLSLAVEEPEFERLQRQETEIRDSIKNFSYSDMLSRDELHDRDALR